QDGIRDGHVTGVQTCALPIFFYALLYAAGGSLVSRQEDLQAVLTPITFVVVGTYLAFFWVVSNPDNPVAIGLSMVPPLSVVLMPDRKSTRLNSSHVAISYAVF